ncbi:TonB-dependent receptor plug domain-containing protein [Spirosoma taeanense]|uniref:TonB-dependent receptor plug domain-containing protein n=1 Tax=Spirosoma taeanense TaxID=2735870 RepID=A0A6M5YDM2_9BACT|nr:TonB-dependent receptor [Spirosoma taeanense]QJW92117.1 TonB-dependent receptor plug domain-containing protein [Spirosoma taeanense]
MNRNVLSILLTLISCAVLAQTGTVRGTVKDGKTKEALIGCTVRIDGTQLGGTTDIEGGFAITNVPAGTQKVIISYISYQTKEIPNVRVESGNTTAIETELDEEGKSLQEVVVRASRATNTEVAVITEIKQMKPLAVGISAQQIQKSQDRDAAAAIRRVPGISIVDNRFVLIRGLGTRYNNVLINDVITPSTEVESRSFSFDIVPSNILDRMIVYKSGSAENPGDFAGGIIKIYTKRRPDQNFTDVGFTIGYRPNTTFRSVLSHDRGGMSFLGLWNKEQQIPTSFPARANDFNALNAAQRAAYARLLPNAWGLRQVTVNPDVRLALNLGRRFEIGNTRISNLTSINYSLTNQATDIDLSIYQNGATANDVFERYDDANYQRQTRLGVLHNWTLRFTPRFTLEWKTLFNLMSTTETLNRMGQRVVDGLDVQAFSERFENRSIVSTQVSGEHSFSELSKFNWIGAYSYSGRWEPDWRRARFQRTTGAVGTDGQLAPFSAIIPNQPNPIDNGRFFSNLGEHAVSAIGNYEHTFGNPTDREPNRFKAGFYTEQRNRTYSARFYGYERVGNVSTSILGQPLNTIFGANNITGQPGGFSLLDGTKDLDSYRGINTYGAAYVQGDVNLGSRINVTLGFRGEFNNQTLHSDINRVTTTLVDRTIFSPLPSLNAIYKLSDRQNFRLAYSATVNRPELRELAPFTYYDFNLLADVRGNPTLTTASIQNLDAKYEFYPTPNEVVSITGFYKQFTNPIETFLLPAANGLAYTFINARSARNYGVEIEVRKGFAGSASAFLQNIQFVGNASFINSRINLGQSVTGPDLSGRIGQYDLTNIQAAERPLQNQSPYLINAGVYYAQPNGWQANLLYNVAGPRIFAVGNQNQPTVYEMARNVVDFNISRQFGKQLELRFGIQDILNAPFRFAQDYNDDGKISKDVTSQNTSADQNYRVYRRGQYFTLTGVYTFGRRTIIP